MAESTDASSTWAEDAHRIGKTLPERVVVGRNGAYWRDYGDHYSMCPVSDDNDPVAPVATYARQVGSPPELPDVLALIREDAAWLIGYVTTETQREACARILRRCDGAIS